MARYLLFVLAIVLAACKPSESTDLKAIIGAVLINGTGGPPISDSVVVVAGDRIRWAGARADVPIPQAAEKIDGSGKFIVPGLIDLHVHLGTRSGPDYRPADYTRDRIEKNLNTYLYFGVTSVRSIGTDREAGIAVRNSERAGDLFTARMFTAGRGFTAPGGHPSQEVGNIARQVDDPDEARKQVDELASEQVDAIKMWVDDLGGKQPKIKPAVMQAILEEARKYNIPVTAHIATLADVTFLVDNGISDFLHMISDTEKIDPDFLAKLRNLQIVFAPTLVRKELGWLYQQHPDRLNDPEVVRSVDPQTLAAVKAWVAAHPAGPSPGFQVDLHNTRKLSEAGVPIAVGSDGGSAIDFPGLMTHRELELLVEAGLSPMQVIVAATRNGALALRKQNEFGTIEPGKRADLLLVSANPTEDVRNLRKIDRVMLDGQWVDRDSLKLY
jgi:imidazolonepropionase-like amidohydrolase